MNGYTIEMVRHGDEIAIYTFQGYLGAAWERQAVEIWQFWRAGKRFVVLSLNFEAGKELASVAVDQFLKPATNVEMIDLRRMIISGRSQSGFQK